MRSDFHAGAPFRQTLFATVAAALPFLAAQPATTLAPSPNAPTQNTYPVAALPLPGTDRLLRRRGRIGASGTIIVGVDATVQFSLVAGTDPVFGNNTLIAQTPAVAHTAAGVGAPYWLDYNIIVDTITGKMLGTQSSFINNTIQAASVLTASLTGLSAKTEPVVNLSMFVTFSVANAGSYATLDDFGLEI